MTAMTVFNPCIPFGENLKKIRESKSISQEKLAEFAEMDRTYISGIERGRRNLSLKNIFKLAEALGITPSELLNF
jgi:transcriptional regulator with XRE-family HTH domain